jgi:hypothetical protein
MKITVLDRFEKIEIDPSETEAGSPFGALRSPPVNLARARLLEPANVVSALADEHA